MRVHLRITAPLKRVEPLVHPKPETYRLKEPLQTLKDPVLKSDRYTPCFHLKNARIPHFIWSVSDSMQFYGSRKEGTGDLDVIVNDVEEAARTLQEHGFLRTDLPGRFNGGINREHIKDKAIRMVSLDDICQVFKINQDIINAVKIKNDTFDLDVMINSKEIIGPDPPGLKVSGVNLLKAADWRFHVPEFISSDVTVPIEEYFNWAVKIWMDPVTRPFDANDHAHQIIIAMINDVDFTWHPRFEHSIRKEYRQILLDLLWTRKLNNGADLVPLLLSWHDPGFRDQHRHVRDQILAGKHDPKPMSGLYRRRPATPLVLVAPPMNKEITKKDLEDIQQLLPKWTWVINPRIFGPFFLCLNISAMRRMRSWKNTDDACEKRDAQGNRLLIWRDQGVIFHRDYIPFKVRFPLKQVLDLDECEKRKRKIEAGNFRDRLRNFMARSHRSEEEESIFPTRRDYALFLRQQIDVLDLMRAME